MLARQELLAWTAAEKVAGSLPLGCLERIQRTGQHEPQPLQHCENLLAVSILQRKHVKLSKPLEYLRV